MISRFPIRCVALAAAIVVSGLPSLPTVVSRTDETTQTELRIRVVDRDKLGARVQVDLQHAGSGERVSAFTDWIGNVRFQNLPPGNYRMVIAIDGKELYRSQITKGDAPGMRVVRLANVAFSDHKDRVSANDLAAPPRAYTNYQAGLKEMRSGNLEKALEALERALAIYPSYSRAHTTRGVILHLQDRYIEAEDAFRNAIRFDSDAVEPRYNLGLLLIQHQRPGVARAELEKAFALANENAAVAELLLESMLQTHDEVSAVSLVRSLHGRRVVHPARIHLRIARELKTHGLFELASEQYSFAVQDDPSRTERHELETGFSDE